MRRTLRNRPISVIVVLFTLSSAWLLHHNPFGDGTIGWPVALLVALVGNLFFAYVIAGWAAPFLASTGGPRGASEADPGAVAVAERWTAGTILLFGTLALVAVSLAAKPLVITPTQRLERNAQLVRETVERHAPEAYRRQLNGADTWKMSERTFRTCVPTKNSVETGWCVLVRAEGDDLRVISYGPGKSNAAQALEWHPEWKDQPRR